MKKVILIVVLFLSFFSAQSQDREQFEKSYNIILTVDEKGERSEWMRIEDCRIFYNYGGKSDKIKAYLSGIVVNYTQIKETIYSITDDGKYKYALLHLKDDESGKEIALQYFEDESLGIRFIFPQGEMIQLAYTEL